MNKTAQILIVGDEILSGRTLDTNSHYISHRLSLRGVRVRRIEVLPDEPVILAEWIRTKHQLADYTLVCGGIGGTSDDVTREAVARGVGVKLERNKEADRILRAHFGSRVNDERMLMADLPEGCTLIDNPVTKAPGFKIRNIYVMAGVPEIMKAMFENIVEEFETAPLFEKEINLQVGEGDIGHLMKIINKEFRDVELGSYPTMDASRGYKTQLVFKCQSEKNLDVAVERFNSLFDSLVRQPPNS